MPFLWGTVSIFKFYCMTFSLCVESCEIIKEWLALLFLSRPKCSTFNETKLKNQRSFLSRNDIDESSV